MAQVRWFCPVLMIPSLVGLFTGEVAYNKSVCKGDSIQLFENIKINDSDTSATLHKNGDKYQFLARWTIEGHSFNEIKNLFMDDKNNLWIINVDLVDEGIYQITYTMPNGTNPKSIVQLSVCVAPKDNCNILVTPRGQILEAGLSGKDKDCGKPKVSVYWKNNTGVTVHEEKVLQLQPGNEAGTYYACMRGIALSCAKSSDPSADHCHPWNVNKGQSQSSTVGGTTQLSFDGSKDSIHIATVVGLVLVLVLVPVISFGIYIVYKQNRCCCKSYLVSRLVPPSIHTGDGMNAEETEGGYMVSRLFPPRIHRGDSGSRLFQSSFHTGDGMNAEETEGGDGMNAEETEGGDVGASLIPSGIHTGDGMNAEETEGGYMVSRLFPPSIHTGDDLNAEETDKAFPLKAM